MYIIIERKRHYVQKRITDYLGKFNVKIIDLRYKRGRILFNKILHRAKSTQRKEKKKEGIDPYQRELKDFCFLIAESSEPPAASSFKLPYRQKVRRVGPEEFLEGKLPWAEIEALRNFETSNGYFKDLFLLNNFRFWDELELSPKQEETFGRYFIGDIVKLEIGRCKLGCVTFTDWVKDLGANTDLLASFPLENERIPDAHNYGRLVTAIGATNLRAFHAFLVKKFEQYELVDYKIGIWDGRFFMSNCSGQKLKKTGLLSDPDCGKYNKGHYRGPGYIESPIEDWKFNLILHYDVIKANTNDKVAFRETFQGYLAEKNPSFTYFLTDGGAGASHKNLQLVHGTGAIPILRWVKSTHRDVIKTPKGYYFNVKYIPERLHLHLDELYAFRTGEERSFSPFTIVYRRTRMPNRGKENALIFAGFNAITQGLTALTAYKTGRIDLTRAATAFRDVYSNSAPEEGWYLQDRQIYSEFVKQATEI